jgi:A/G-specific adenine glycosylase
MLQQTQVGRVIEKYKAFLKAFPTVHSLANAPLQQVLLLWSGLGYNRRARFLQQMAQAVDRSHGIFPTTVDKLLKLPGIGTYTAGAISAFAYNQPRVFIETNIRTVFLHHFALPGKVADKELLALIAATLDHKNPREWYWALMDYGSHLKSTGITIHRTSRHYAKQSAFKGSVREVRGGILKILTKQPATLTQLRKSLSFQQDRIEQALRALQGEQIIMKKAASYVISTN